MALNAVFKADFSNFYDAVQKAQVKLVDLSEGAGKVGTSLDKMTKGFSGQKIIQDAHLMTAAMVNVGGMTALTDKELRKLGTTVGEASDKMRRMGVEVPPGFQKITDATTNVGTAASGSTKLLAGLGVQLAGMFTIGAIVAFGKEVLAAGDKIQKMADQTGLGTDEVQRLQYVAGQSGVSMETLVSAVQNLQQRLGDDNTGAAAAMKKLGINADAFAKLNTYQQVLTLSDALRNVTDANERASLGAAIFGKTWKEVGPAVLSEMKKIGDEAPVMSDKTVKSLDRAGDAMDRFKRQTLVWGAAVVNGFLDARLGVEDFLTRFNPSNWGLAASQVQKIRTAMKEGDGLAGAFDQAAKGAAKLVPALQGVKAVVEATWEETQEFNKSLEESVERNKAAARAAEEVADAIQKTRAAIIPLTAAQKAQVVEWDKFGVSAETSGKALGISGIAVKNYLDSLILLGKEIPTVNAGMANFEALASSASLRSGLIEMRLNVDGVTDSLENFTNQFINKEFFPEPSSQTLEQWEKGQAVITATGEKIINLGVIVKSNLRESLAEIPDLLKAAFTGGGDLIGAAKAIGVSLAESITVPIFAALSNLQKHAVTAGSAAATALGGSAAGGMGATVAGIASSLGGAALAASAWGTGMTAAGVAGSVALGAATLGIGAAAVGVVALIKKWKDHQKQVAENTKQIGAFQDSIHATLTPMQAVEAAGRPWAATVISVRDAYLATGRSAEDAERDVKAMWDSTTGGAGASQAAIDRVNEAFIEQKQRLDEIAEAGMAIETMRERFAVVEERLARLVSISPDVKAALDLAFNAETPEAYKVALDEVNTALDAQAAEAQFLEDTMKKYGIAWTSLGEEARKAKVAETSRDIIKEFDVLNNAGVKVNEIMKKMGPNVNDFVKEARLSGTEVPEQFRKIIQAGIDAGVIFGDDKRKITEMKDTGIVFGTSMEETMKKASESMAASIERLVKVLEDKLIKNLETVKGKTEKSEQAFEDWAETAVDAADDVSEAIDDVSFGHSPGGLKEFPILLKKAETAFKHFSGVSKTALAGTDRQLSLVTLGSGRMRTPPTLMTSGGGPRRFDDGGLDFGGGGGSIHITVEGSVISERELAGIVDEFSNRRNQLRNKVRAA